MSEGENSVELPPRMIEIRRYESLGYSNEEIIIKLSISREVYFQCITKMCQHELVGIQKQTKEEVAHQIAVLKERLLHTIRNCESIATNEDFNAFTRIEAEKMKVEAAVNLLNLVVESPEILRGRPMGYWRRGSGSKEMGNNNQQALPPGNR